MITEDNKLNIFESFSIDNDLPKYKDKQTLNNNTVSGFTINEGDIGISNINPINFVTDGNFDNTDRYENSIVKKFNQIFNKVFKKDKKKINSVSIQIFFTQVSSSIEELHTQAKYGAIYEEAIENAQKLGQVALVEKLFNMKDVYRCESTLIASRLTKYVTEKNVVDFYKIASFYSHLS